MILGYKALFSTFPIIQIGEFELKQIDEKLDAKEYFLYQNKPQMNTFLSEGVIPKTLHDAELDLAYWGGLFDQRRSVYWGIYEKNDSNIEEDNELKSKTDTSNDLTNISKLDGGCKPRLVGTVGFNSISFSHSRADISYELDPDYWGRGIMLKAIKGILNFCDTYVGLSRIQATTVVYNERSIKLLKRCGFEEEGVLKKYEIINDKRENFCILGRVI